jgi:hypothetical protein
MRSRGEMRPNERVRVLAALLRISRPEWQDFDFAFHDDVEVGPRMLARIAKHTGLTQEDL